MMTAEMPTGRQVLDVPMQSNDAEAATIREYLIALLTALWDNGEGFSGKHPFGNSGWDWDLYEALAKAGHIDGKFDDDGYLDDVDKAKGRKLISQAILALGATAVQDIARHDPAREVEAKRRILEQYEASLEQSKRFRQRAASGVESDAQKLQRSTESIRLLVLLGVVKLLALPYSGHEAYREKRRP